MPFRQLSGLRLAVVVLVPGLRRARLRLPAFRSRIKGVYFSILTQALTYGAALMFFRNDFTFGGNNGLTDFKFLLGFDVNSAATKRGALHLSGCFCFSELMSSAAG